MSVGQTGHEVSFCSKESFYYRIRKFIRQVWQGYRRWEMLKKHSCLLLEMDDYLLKDIGISRADAVRFSRQRDSLWKCIFKNAAADQNHSDQDRFDQ
ncbi:DUF1127 domain-containing protein [Desulfobacter curvatus]|uniref:DUF1127 domain-containing protein n=1 Tax=Desulfobacter curvatus TaxID=2290 RepID=UPI000367EA43|nr:DUF1127 domain-containing protein [Desulfobacter curvatus]